MLKRTLIILAITTALMVVVEPRQTASGILVSKAEWAKVNLIDNLAPDNSEKQEQRGNGLVRALQAPFKAIGRLFGRGKKDSNKLQRLSEKDAKKFESAPGTHVNNGAMVIRDNTAESSAGSNETTALEHLEKGRALLSSGHLNAAVAELSGAASLDPKLSEAQTLLGVAYDRKGLRDRAQKSFETALHSSDDEGMHLNNLGYLLYKNGDYEGAIKYLKRAAKLNPDDQRIWNNLGMAQCGSGRFDDAYKSFARVVGEFQGRLKVAAYVERQGPAKETIKQLEKANRLRPGSTEVLARLVVLYGGAGRIADANEARASIYVLKGTAPATR
jgi:Tfp pilus assembly protein PilF